MSESKVMIRCEDCDVIMTQKKYQSHLKKHAKNLFCPTCRTTVSFTSFRDHIKTHYLQSLYDFGRYIDDVSTKQKLLNEEPAPSCIFGNQPMIMQKQENRLPRFRCQKKCCVGKFNVISAEIARADRILKEAPIVKDKRTLRWAQQSTLHSEACMIKSGWCNFLQKMKKLHDIISRDLRQPSQM